MIPANYDVCPVCGKVLRQGVKPSNNDKGKGLAIASLSLGIVAAALSLFGLLLGLWLCVPGLVCGIAGLVTAKKARKNGCISGIQTAGLIVSIIATVVGGIGLTIMIIRIVGLMVLSATFGDTSVPEETKTIDQLGGATILLRSLLMI